MNIQDIRKAFNNWTGTPTTKLESDIEDYINKHTHRNDEFLTMYGYFNGYKDGQESCKCCGNCNLWKYGPTLEFDLNADYTCTSTRAALSGLHTTALDGKDCPEWEVR